MPLTECHVPLSYTRTVTVGEGCDEAIFCREHRRKLPRPHPPRTVITRRPTVTHHPRRADTATPAQRRMPHRHTPTRRPRKALRTHSGQGPNGSIVGVVSSRLLCARTPVQPPPDAIVGVTAVAKLSARLASVTTDDTQPSDCPSTVTTTAQGTHSGKGPTGGIVGVTSPRPKHTPVVNDGVSYAHARDRRGPPARGRQPGIGRRPQRRRAVPTSRPPGGRPRGHGRVCCAPTHRRSPHRGIVGVTSPAKPDSRSVSATTDDTHLSARALTATTTAQGTHSGKGPTRRIVGVTSPRRSTPRRAPRRPLRPRTHRASDTRRSRTARATKKTPQPSPTRPHTPARLRD